MIGFKKKAELELKIVQAQWFQSLNKQCPMCSEKLIFKNSSTLCNCYVFCHKECFIKKYNEQNANQFMQKIQCQECKEPIKVQFERQNLIETRLTWQKVTLLIGIALLMLVDLVALTIEFQMLEINFFRLIGELIVLILLMGLMTFALISIIFKVKYMIKKVFHSDRKIKISAFQGILTERAETDEVEEVSNVSNDPMSLTK